MYKCVCGREFEKGRSYSSHTKFCKKYCEVKGRAPGKPYGGVMHQLGHKSWNKGMHHNLDYVKHPHIRDLLLSYSINYFDYGMRNISFMSKLSKDYMIKFIDLNDDLKLGHKIYNKLGPNSWGHGIECNLSTSDLIDLLIEANIKSSDWSRGKYDLSRYNDEGPYSKENCKFIRHIDNMREIHNK